MSDDAITYAEWRAHEREAREDDWLLMDARLALQVERLRDRLGRYHPWTLQAERDRDVWNHRPAAPAPSTTEDKKR